MLTTQWVIELTQQRQHAIPVQSEAGDLEGKRSHSSTMLSRSMLSMELSSR